MREEIIDFSKYTSLKIGAPMRVTIIESSDIQTLARLQNAQNLQGGANLDSTNLDSINLDSRQVDSMDLDSGSVYFASLDSALAKLRIIGHGNNVLIAPNAQNLAMLDRSFDYIKDCGEYVEAGGKCTSGKIFAFFRSHNLGGLEFLQSLPGSAGGLLKMNAGMKQYEMSNIVLSACLNGVWKENLGLGYRTSGIKGIISAVRFKKQAGFSQEIAKECAQMRKTHPKLPSCGSCFKNPKGDYAGRLLEAAGLKGFMKNGVGFSKEHANFLVNSGGGDFASALEVIEYAQEKVLKKYGVKLELEVQIFR